MATAKSEAFADTEKVLLEGFGSLLFGEKTVTSPPVKLPALVGVTTTVTVVLVPAGSAAIVQTAVELEVVAEQLPCPAVAETKVSGRPAVLKSSLNVTCVARSGPLLLTV